MTSPLSRFIKGKMYGARIARFSKVFTPLQKSELPFSDPNCLELTTNCRLNCPLHPRLHFPDFKSTERFSWNLSLKNRYLSGGPQRYSIPCAILQNRLFFMPAHVPCNCPLQLSPCPSFAQAQYVNDNYNVEGLCRGFPNRIEAVFAKNGDRLPQ